MADIGSIESIESLVKDARIQDGLAYITFQPPSGGEEVRTVVPVQPPAPAEAGAASSPEEPFLFSLVRTANGLVRDVLGYHAAFDAATTAVDSAVDEAEGRPAHEKLSEQAPKASDELDADTLEDVLYRGFERVMHLFAWDPSSEEWVVVHDARGLGSELQRQLKLAPVASTTDRDILEHMLIETATVDGELDRVEEEVLLEFVDRSKLTRGQAAAGRVRVNQNDLRQTTPGQPRETLYMLACVVALADAKFKTEESDKLEYYAKGLNLEEHRAEELLEAAQLFFIEQYMVRRFAATGELDEDAREEVRELAENLEYDPDQAELAFERYQRVKDSGGGFSSGLSW